MVQQIAKMNDLRELPRARAISNTSGGTGKKIDSVNARIKSERGPYGVSAQCSTQSYTFFNDFI